MPVVMKMMKEKGAEAELSTMVKFGLQLTTEPDAFGSLLIFVGMQKTDSPFYSAPSIFAVFRNLFEKSGSRNLVQEKWLTRKKGGFIL